MSSQALAAQWSVNSTATGGLEVARGLMRAATTDNVQPLAIMACESFGSTIAMSREVILKIEKTVVPAPKPAVLSFLQGTVGYAANDSTAELGRSAAGVRFLGLTAALVTTMGSSKSAETVQALLEEKAADRTQVPTYQHVRGLLERLEGRCHLSGFSDTIVGWEILITQAWRARAKVTNWDTKWHLPEPQGILNLINAFDRLGRPNRGDTPRATIRTRRCAPWTAAFCKWCLGVPPVVIFDDGWPVLEHGDSAVTIIVTTGSADVGGIDVAVDSVLDGLSSLMQPCADRYFACMVSVESYGQLLRQDSGLDQSLIEECMPYLIRSVLDGLQFRGKDIGTRNLRVTNKPAFEKLRATHGLSPFPTEKAILSTMAVLLGARGPLPALPPSHGSMPLSLEKGLQWLQILCECSKCVGVQSSDLRCKKVDLATKLALIVADVLALSLFNGPKLPLVLSHSFGIDEHDNLFRSASSAIVSKVLGCWEDGPFEGHSECSSTALLEWALRLVAHHIDDVRHWTVSSFRGQAVWPTIFETGRVFKDGYLSLSWAQGNLLYNRDPYNEGYGPSCPQAVLDPVNANNTEEVIQPMNLCVGLRLQWRVTPVNEKLKICLSASDGTSVYPYASSDPANILHTLAMAFMVNGCAHDRRKKLSSPDRCCTFTGPFQPVIRSAMPARPPPSAAMANSPGHRFSTPPRLSLDKEMLPPVDDKVVARARDPTLGAQHVNIVAVDGSEDLRLFALSNMISFDDLTVLRRDACLQCCLSLCRQLPVAGNIALIL